MTVAAGRAPCRAALLAAGLGIGGLAAAGLGAGDLAAAGTAGEAPVLEVLDSDGAPLARLPLGAEGQFCLHWRHSVTQGAVADCFRAGAGAGAFGGELVLERSFLHDFAAGLGEVPGRGVARAAARGGYWIEGIDEALPGGALTLRVGAPEVGHRIETAARALDLSALAAGRRVVLRPVAGP